jgi:hypothetical protein
MNQHWIVLSLLSGLALSQVPSSKPKVVRGQLYRLHVEAWPQEARRVVIRHAGLEVAAKTLTPFDPDWTLYWRATSNEMPVADAPLTIREVKDPLAIESSADMARPVDVELDREYHALGDERPYFTGKPEEGIHWYRVRNDKASAVVAYLSVGVTDRELPSDIETFARGGDGKWSPYREGGFAYLPEATQTMPGLASFRVRRLEPGGEYLLRVAGNHPSYQLRLRRYRVERDAAEAVRMGMDFLVSLGAGWHANVPRRGAVATRETLPHGEIQGCVACHPTVFTLRAYDAARARGWAGVNADARRVLEEQLKNHPRPLPGHEGVNWTRTIFSARAISARSATWTRELLPYLKLTGTEHWAEEADGAAPNVSPFEIAYARYSALKEPAVAARILSEPAQNVIDLNWKIVAMAEMGRDVDTLVDQLFAVQRADGLFPYHFDVKEEGAEFITWHALYALSRAGLTTSDPRVKRLYELCLSRQKASGEWQGESRHKAFDTPFRDTQFAVMALSALVKPVAAPEPVVAMREFEPGKVGAIERAALLRRAMDAPRVLALLGSAAPMKRLEGLRVFATQFRDWTSRREVLDLVLRLLEDEQPLLRFQAVNAVARWYGWQADYAEMASAILRAVSGRIGVETNPTVQGALKQALYTMIDENEGYLATWNAAIADEALRAKTVAGLEARRHRVQLAFAHALHSATPAGKVHLLESLWDHPQRHAGLPADIEGRSEVVLPAYFSDYSRGVDGLHQGGYEPHAQSAGFRYGAANRFYKTRVGNDSELPDLGVVLPALEREWVACLESGDPDLTRSAIRALSVFPAGLSGRLAVAVVKLAAGPFARDVRFVFAGEARGKLTLEQPNEFQFAIVDGLLGALKPGAEDALATLLPALAAVTPGEGPTRDPRLQGRIERLLLQPAGVPVDLALAAAGVFPHIADGPLMRATMLEAFSSGDRLMETAAVEIFVRSYIAEPTNPVLGKQFAEKAGSAMRRRMLDALDPSRFALRLSALNRYNPGRDVVLPEDANLFSSDVARHLLGLGVRDADAQVRRAASELIWSYEELAAFRSEAPKPIAVEPDYEFFKQRVQPVLAKVGSDGRACVVCHATQGQFALRMPGKTGFSETQSRFNYEAVLAKLNRQDPKQSLLLMKPTRPNDNAGDPSLHTSTHGGGTRWGRDTREATASEEYETILSWIRGAKF